MKIALTIMTLLCAAALVSLKLCYQAGKADGWQMGGNDVQTVIDYRQRITILGSKATPEGISAAWNAARVGGAERDRAWFGKKVLTRIAEAGHAKNQEIWRRDSFPAELIPPGGYKP